ncbi:MAG: DUF3466 family protein, partial [Nitrospira sp.]|nr:DUF3466 family protein [Nitrospira sp.]
MGAASLLRDAWGSAFAITDSGDIVGDVQSPAYGFVVHSLTNGFQNLNDLLPAGSSWKLLTAKGINQAGQIVGAGLSPSAPGLRHAYLATLGTSGRITNIGDLHNIGEESFAIAINAQGEVIGQFNVSRATQRAFLYKNGGVIDLNPLPGFTESFARAINNSGVVVGYAWKAGGEERAFLYDGSMKDLNSLLPQNSGWELWRATGINDSGVIVGEGNKGVFLMKPKSGCQVAVTRLGQCTFTPHWGPEQYAYYGSIINPQNGTICRWGCATTSLSMVLNSEGVPRIPCISSDCAPLFGNPNDPGYLDDFLAKYGVYAAPRGLMRWLPAVTQLGIRLNSDGLKTGFTWFWPTKIDWLKDDEKQADVGRQFQEYLDKTLCEGHAIIVGVKRTDDKGTQFPGHYVVVYGKSGNDYLIADPGPRSIKAPVDLGPREKFLFNSPSYIQRYVTRGHITDPPGDTSALSISTGENADVIMTDPSGKVTGLVNGIERDEIPTSAHFIDSIEPADIEGDEAVERLTSHSVEVLHPASGRYAIEIIGLKLGLYNLEIWASSREGIVQPRVTLTGIANTGSSGKFELEYNSGSASASTTKRIATFSSTVGDIDNAHQLGLIKNGGVANSLRVKILNAEKA